MPDEIEQPIEETVPDEARDDDPEVVPHGCDDQDLPWCVGFFS